MEEMTASNSCDLIGWQLPRVAIHEAWETQTLPNFSQPPCPANPNNATMMKEAEMIARGNTIDLEAMNKMTHKG